MELKRVKPKENDIRRQANRIRVVPLDDKVSKPHNIRKGKRISTERTWITYQQKGL